LYYFISPYFENGDLRNALDQDEKLLLENKKLMKGKKPKKPNMNQEMRLKILCQVARAVDFLHTPVPGFR